MSYAIYFEFGKQDGSVYQALFIPATPVGSHVVQPTYAHKHLTAERARRVWDLQVNPNYVLSSDVPANTSDLMLHEVSQLDGLHVYITSALLDPDWSMTGSFPVELSASDILALKENPRKMPTGMNTKIKGLRSAKNFPALPEAAS